MALSSEPVLAAVRALQVEEEPPPGFETAVRVTQIFSGIFFAGLAIWLSFTNGTKLAFIQQASLEKRLTVCCFFGVYVGAVSAFFNFFQLTEVDDILLERPGSFVLDFSRPIEWIATCPLMQLVLVLMGGSRIPEYRRWLMPGLSVTALICATSSMLLWDIWVFVAYGVGVCFASVMFFLNRVQIIEHSDGQEGLLSGDSDFRRASVLLIVTWVPFPMFYALSTEGLGLITDVVFIQVGWAFLNIVSKFTFIFYIQRIKDNYCSRMKVKREFAGVHAAGPAVTNKDGSATPLASSRKQDKSTGEMSALVVETMSFLGMAQNSDRFLRLLAVSNITSLSQLEFLTQGECSQRQLPWDLVSAVQKRLKVWKLEMQDTAELALEQGEAHYQVDEEPTMLSMPGSVRGGATPQSPVMCDDRLNRIEDTLAALQQQSEFQADVMRRLCDQGDSKMEQAIEMTVQATLRAQERAVEGSLQQRLGESMGELVERARARMEQVADRVSDGLQAQAREFQASAERVMNTMEQTIERKLAGAVEDISRANEAAKQLHGEAQNAMKGEKMEELSRSIGRKLEDNATKIMEKQERLTEALRTSQQHDMTTVISRTDMVGDVVKESSLVVKETLGDLRRLCISNLDTGNAGQDLSQQALQRIVELRNAVEALSAQLADRDRTFDIEPQRTSDPPSRPMSATQRDREGQLGSRSQRSDRYGRGALGA